MASPSKRTITDKLCDQAKRQVWAKLERDYERAFIHRPAGDEFFAKMDELLVKVDTHLQVRPLTRAAINSVGQRAGKAFGALIRVETKQKPQPKMRQCISLETGETRLIPDYGE